MSLNGQSVTPSFSDSAGLTTAIYTPQSPFDRETEINVEIAFDDRTHAFSFTTSSGELAMIVTNLGEKESDNRIRQRLQQVFGFDVLMLDDGTVDSGNGPASFSIDDAKALGVKLVYVSSPVNSNKAGAQPWHTSGIALINVEQADIDNFQYLSSGGGINNSGLDAITIVDADHPMAAGFAAGEITFAEFEDTSSRTGIHQAPVGNLPDASTVTVVATTGNGNQGALVAIDVDTPLFDGTTNTARIVHMGITGDDQFRSFTEDGLRLFDYAVAWVLDIEPPVEEVEPGKFNNPVQNPSGIFISWEGAGVLEESNSVGGPWTSAANQSNPQSRSADSTTFFRLKQ